MVLKHNKIKAEISNGLITENPPVSVKLTSKNPRGGNKGNWEL